VARLAKLGRRRRRLATNPIIIIVCEGGKTEPKYFEGIRKARRLMSTHICVYGDGPTDPIGLVKYAKSKRQEARRAGIRIDQVWVVHDRDEHLGVTEAHALAKQWKIRVAFSNPCFELWYLYHFQDQRANIHRAGLISVLKEHIPRYSKAADYSAQIRQHQDEALRRAQECRAWHLSCCRPANENPSTDVDELVSQLEVVENVSTRLK
jgi:hypothetical protein